MGSLALDEAACQVLDSSLAEGEQRSAQWRQGSLAVVTRVKHAVAGKPTFETAVVLDDSGEALARPEFRSDWRTFLHWSNVLGVDTMNTVVKVRSQVASEEIAAPLVDFLFHEDWLEVLGDATAEERAMLLPLQEAGFVPAPEIGEERGDGVVVSALWEDAKLALIGDVDGDGLASVRAEGYETVTEISAVLEHFAGSAGKGGDD